MTSATDPTRLSPSSTDTNPFAPVRKSVRVNADAAHAFKVFTTTNWWPREHSLIPQATTRPAVIIEPHAGGRWYERAEDGKECTWGTVIEWSPPRRVVLGWQINGNFAYDPTATTEVQIDFIPESATTTRVELEHRGFERYADSGAALRMAIADAMGWEEGLAAFARAIEAR